MLNVEFFNVLQGILTPMLTMLLLATSLLGLLASQPASACVFKAPQLTVTTQFDGPTLDRSLGSSSLGAELGGNSSGYVTQGLTKTNSYVRRNISVSLVSTRDGQVCANIENIEVQIGLEGPAQVFVASEIEPGSCRDRVTIEHEQLHINHAFEAQQKSKQAIEQYLALSLRRIVPVVAPDADQATALVGAQLDALIDQIIVPIEAERSAKDRAIDTPSSYRALTAACP
jgi:hypothetical protein